MRLEFSDVWFKNFLSYGNNWNHIKFDPGTNFIVGDINQNVRSNATGKSSALMAVSFAMFGKIQKKVVKEDIVNWQNKKGCEVHLLFYHKGDKILIKRGIKPNFIKVYINNEPIPQDSDLRVAQQKLEDEIIGWNLDMFSNLIYCNPNNTISILDTTAAKKRQFIENLFSDIEYFSDLMEKTKKKLKNIKKNINDNNIKIEFYDKNISDLQNEINDLQNSDVFNVQAKFKKYRELKDEYDKVYEENEGIEDEIKQLESDLAEKKNEISAKEKELSDIKNDIYRIENIDLAKLEKELEESEKNESYKRKLKEIDNYLLNNKDIEKEKQELEDIRKNYHDKIFKKEQELSKCTANIENLQEQLKSLYPDHNLKNKVVCPTCGNEINYEETKEHFKKERKKINNKIDKLEKQNKEICNDIEYNKEEKNKIQEKLDNVNKTYQKVLNYKEQKNQIENFIKDSRSKEEINKEMIEIKRKFEQKQKEKKDVDSKIGTILFERDDIESKMKIKQRDLDKLNDLKTKLYYAETSYNQSKQSAKQTDNMIKDKKKKLKFTQKNKDDIIKKNKKLNNLQDYFEYLKESLKDENIKSYIISTIIPELNNKVNNYLSAVGFDFYVVFDKWMNISINGPGNRTDSKFGCMSGGESKTIDLVTKFALMDIAKSRAKIFPDLLILDEILDSSIDEFGIEKIMGLINYKQEKDGTKIFIISHRKEINDMANGKIYKVVKKDNFSYIKDE